MSNITESCLQDIRDKITGVDLIKTKVFTVYDERDLMDESYHIVKPCVGIMNEGVHAVPDQSNKGMSADQRVALAVVAESKSIGKYDAKTASLNLLKDMRTLLRTTKAPGGYPWRFVAEIPVASTGNLVIYVQRWHTRVILTGS